MKAKYFSLSPQILIIAYCIILITVILYGFSSYKSLTEERKQSVFRELKILTDLKAKRIQAWRNEIYGDAGVLMNNTGLISAYNEWLKNSENEELKSIVINWVLLYEKYFEYKNIILLDKDRNIRLSLNRSALLLDKVSLSNLNTSIINRNPSISNLFFSEIDSAIYLDVASPLYNGDELLGGIILRSDPNDFLYPEINNWPVNSRTTESVLFTVDGDKVVFLNNFRFKDNTALNYKLNINDENEHITAVKAAKGLRGLTEGIDYRGSRTLNDIRQIQGSPWILIDKIDIDEIYEPIKEHTLNHVLSLGFILIIFGVGFIWIWQNRKKSLQIQSLENEKRRFEISENYKRVVKFANVAMILSNTNLQIRDVNERALSLYGYSREEFLEMNVSDLFVTEVDKLPDRKKEEEEKLKEGIIYESIQKRKDNSTFYAEINLSLVEIDGRNYYHRMISDITQRKIAAEKLKKSKEHLQLINAEKDRFFSIIAHDLREPLGSFMNITKMMDESKTSMSDTEKDEYVRLMKESSENLYGLLENLLEWSTMKRGLISTDLKSFRLKDSISKNLEMIKDSSVRKNQELIISIADDLEVYTDERMINGIVRNLGINAVKFTPRRGTITIDAKKADSNKVLLSISDSGIGMSKELIAKLFDSSFNTKRFGTDGEPSSGLGLIICKEFTELIGGEIYVESEIGKGSSFKILLQGKKSDAQPKDVEDKMKELNTI